MTLAPEFRAFIDESNTPLFKLGRDDSQRPYVTGCAIIPSEDQLPVRMAIPESPITGERLKSSSREMNDSAAAEFIASVLATQVEVAIVGIDAGDSGNIAGAANLTVKANILRKDQKRPPISTANAMYLLAAWEALLRSVESFYLRNAVFPSPLEVVFDQANLKAEESEFVSWALKDVCAKRGLIIGSVSWSLEQDEPLLLVPDIFSGVLRRQATHGDLPLAWDVIQLAIQTKRIVYRDGIAAPVIV